METAYWSHIRQIGDRALLLTLDRRIGDAFLPSHLGRGLWPCDCSYRAHLRSRFDRSDASPSHQAISSQFDTRVVVFLSERTDDPPMVTAINPTWNVSLSWRGGSSRDVDKEMGNETRPLGETSDNDTRSDRTVLDTLDEVHERDVGDSLVSRDPLRVARRKIFGVVGDDKIDRYRHCCCPHGMIA